MKKLEKMEQVANKNVCSNGMIAINWSFLLSHLLHNICTKLSEMSDFVRFRAVCKAWCSSISLSDHSSFLPWILVNRDAVKNEDLQFYSPFSNKTYNIYVPQALGARLMGPAKGYFLRYKYSDMSLSLLNPITSNEIPLPPLNGDIRYPIPLNGVMAPERSEDEIVILGQNGTDLETLSLGISQLGDANWIVTELTTINIIGSCAYYNGMCFISEPLEGHTIVNNAITGNTVSTIPDFKKIDAVEALEHLVESGGKLLKIFINNYRNTEQLSLEVHVLKVERGYRWLEIKDIDNHILFLDRYGAFSLTSSECHGLRGNCIYFFSHVVKVNNEVERCLLHRYELGDGNIKTLSFPFMMCGTWIIPSMR